MGFHDPTEALRIMTIATDLARQAEIKAIQASTGPIENHSQIRQEKIPTLFLFLLLTRIYSSEFPGIRNPTTTLWTGRVENRWR